MSGINFDASSFFQGMADAEIRMRTAVERYGQAASGKLEARAKQERPWQDRTGNARNSIQGFSGWGDVSGTVNMVENGKTKDGQQKYTANGFEVESQGGGVMTVGVSGNMEYSPYLELAHEKAYAVLWPTLEALTPEIVQGMNSLLGK